MYNKYKIEQWEYIKDCIKWGTDYFIKCHTGKNELCMFFIKKN